ncbi:hypothetical protein EMIHUDRAFT_199561 [Emiliania huxleyi CCMP1516]|uniref:HTH myb-type domain-containing protein n=2 Tax=Emiliania huxleyi TaxID=2903 RepID=A0A0D3KZU0_EMIH1|nr:hypothetical protein EMIHUDRAFT_199561 [Emiliania huxleyi CCMP1516]EOD41275.1 hypothetical protein EMIHUDRAFT_199561 [Emiliania huxleyi CCMP1516]|eukprot:XP_005793704.1 hypothetical protein EMIHUDRAFT_199561 [Emiliania huxleyi CCMP1516]
MAMRPRRPRKVADGSGEPAARGKQQHSRSGAGESRGGGGEESDGEGGAPEAGEPAEKKARFVWTPEMHLRFERAVHKLGVPHAKPQAIRQLMGCEGEEYAPTRQNIKSHLQKYRQSRQNSSHAADGPTMRPEQLTRLAQHVMLQRQLLHHLFALLQAHTEDVMREGGLGASQAGALQGLSSPLGQSQPIDVPEVSSQLEVFGGFDGMDSSVG